MVRIPYIKIPSVRVGEYRPTSNIGTGGATPAPPTPITYLTQWKMLGNSEVHGQEIWSCGEPRTNSITLFDGTQELSEGWVPSSGAYPTTESSYPNAEYYVMDVKAGYVITYSNGSNTRLRLIANGSVIGNISANDDNTYIKVSSDYTSSGKGNIMVKQDCQIAILIINPQQSYIGAVIATETKYHILVQPQGGSIADIALTEPLRKVNDVADKIEFEDNVATVTRNINIVTFTPQFDTFDSSTTQVLVYRNVSGSYFQAWTQDMPYILCNKLAVMDMPTLRKFGTGQHITLNARNIYIQNADIEQTKEAYNDYFTELGQLSVIYKLETPTTELVDAPQIQEAESYTCEISQGAKAVSWSSFETE